MFKTNFKKHIKRGAIAGYSNYERFRMFAGAAEIVYLNPSIKRLEQIKTYSDNLMKSDYTDRDVKEKQEFYVQNVKPTDVKRCIG